MKVLVVSPHYDDAPLSLGQSMRDGWLAEQTVTVGVVFGASNWTVWFRPTPQRTPIATAIRLAEETYAAARFRYRVRVAPGREAVLRLGTTRTERLLDPGFVADDDPEVETVTSTLRKWAARYDALVVPSGIGHHVDHLLCAAAGRRLADLGNRVAFYEDRPYACTVADEDIAAHVAAMDPTLRPRAVSGPVGTEKHRQLFYPSQFDEFFLDAIAADEDARRVERLWAGPDAEWLPAPVPYGPGHKERS